MKNPLPAIVALIAAALAAASAGASPEIPGAPQDRPLALVGGVIHPVSQPPIEDGVLLMENGRITAVGKRVRIPAGARKVDVAGKHVYPGLFDAATTMGLVEISAVRATRDYSETGRINPNVQAQVAVNPDSETIPVARSSGVLLALAAPSGGLISGRSAILQLDGWTWEDLTLKPDAAMHIDWPSAVAVLASRSASSASDPANGGDPQLLSLQQAFDDADAYRRAREAPGGRQALDVRWEAMLPVLAGQMPIVVAADEVQQIEAAAGFAAQHKLKLIIYGGYDAPQCAELLKQLDVAVIVGGIHRLPLHRSDDYDAPFTLPERLHRAGVKFCISAGSGSSSWRVGNLPYQAATAAAYGLPRDEALKAITLYPAEILAIADRVGALEPGKDATLLIATGDPLEASTIVEAAYIQGRQVDLSDRHKRLWHKYQVKYDRLEAAQRGSR